MVRSGSRTTEPPVKRVVRWFGSLENHRLTNHPEALEEQSEPNHPEHKSRAEVQDQPALEVVMNAFRVATYVHSTGRTYVRSALAQRRGALEAEHDGIPCGHPGALFHYRLSTHGRKDGRPRARNRYAGYCYYCGYAVGVNEGCIEKSNGQWVVFC